MSIKDKAPPNRLKTNENKTVLILDSYYNNTNLNLWKKIHLEESTLPTIQKEIQFFVF